MIANLSNSAAPRSLKIVAYLFLIGGIFSVIDTVVELFIGRLSFNLGVLIIVIGLGLLRFNPRSLAWAMFFTWIGLVFLPIAAVASMLTATKFQVFGLDVGKRHMGFVAASASLCLRCMFGSTASLETLKFADCSPHKHCLRGVEWVHDITGAKANMPYENPSE